LPTINLSSVIFTDAEKAKMDAAIAYQKAVMAGKSTNLTEKEKQVYRSINEQNKLVVQKVFKYRVSKPKIIPWSADMPELNRDYASRNTLELWEDGLKLMLSNVQNAKILLDYDVFQPCLSVYRNVRYQAGEDVPSMAAINNDLKEFFRVAAIPTLLHHPKMANKLIYIR
jgi:hypothetical protein